MRRLFACLMLASLGIVSVAADSVPMIVKDGKPNAQIIIAAENRPRMATLAALELQYHIQKISGARLPIAATPDAKIPVKIYVGKSAGTEKLGVKADSLKNGAFRMVSGNGWLILLGDDYEYASPSRFIPGKRGDVEKAKTEWKAYVKEKTGSDWIFPFSAIPKMYWNPSTFEKTMSARYGADSAALWKTGGNTINGFWEYDEAGSLNAVCKFLSTLGCRWYMPGDMGEVVPKISSIPLSKVDSTENPDYAMRDWLWYNYSGFAFDDVLWSRHLGMNSGYRKIGLVSGPHGLVFVFGSEEARKNHPEFFATFSGKKDTDYKGHGTPCFNSDEFEKETVKYLRFMFDEFNFPLMDIWPGDGLKPCQCDKCKGMTPSEMVWGFANRVATEVYKTHPDKLVSCGAYTSYIEAPDTIKKFSPNLAVWISNAGRPKMTDPDYCTKHWARMQKWTSKLAPERIIRYENNRYHLTGEKAGLLSFPVMHTHAVAKELKALKGISMGDTGEQSQFGGKWVAIGLGHTNLYTQSRFLWDADQDLDKMLDEYYNLFYGPAAKEMKEAFTFAEQNIAVKDTSRGAGKGDFKNVPLEVSVKFRDLLQKAKEAAGDTIYGKRIDLVISELEPKEKLIAKHEEMEKAFKEARANAPAAIGVDGTDLSKSLEYFLKNVKTGGEPHLKTSFKVGWDKNAIIFQITCKDTDVKKLAPASDVYSGEFIAITIQTQLHTHYMLEINPDGLIMEGNPARGWESSAEAKPERGEDFWRLTVRIPVVGKDEADADPNNHVAGFKPTANAPWYINIGRFIQKSTDGKDEIQLFSVSKKGAWHTPEYFGKLEIK